MNTGIKIATLAIAIALAGASGASAETPWQASHPRRAEVNARLERQNHRIAAERREGALTLAQAHRLHARDHAIRAQERADAAEHHGHITHSEQRRLNHEENRVSRGIGR